MAPEQRPGPDTQSVGLVLSKESQRVSSRPSRDALANRVSRARQRFSGASRLRHLVVSDRVAFIALLLLAFVGTIASVGPIVAPHDPAQQNLRERLLPPSWVESGNASHVLGTDSLGRDNLSRIIVASRTSVVVALSVVAITLLIGTALGLIAGFIGGRWDHGIMLVTDTIMAFPGLLLIMTIAAVLGSGMITIIVALSVRYWTTYTRITRAHVLSLRETEFILASAVTGGTKFHVVAKHLLPNIVSPLVALVPLGLAQVMLAEASVSFLGFGVQPPTTSWGRLVAEGREYIRSAWWLITFPGLILFATILSANMLGSFLRLATDPIHRGTLRGEQGNASIAHR